MIFADGIWLEYLISFKQFFYGFSHLSSIDTPATICLGEDAFRTSWKFLLFLSSKDIFKTRLDQDKYIRLVRRLPDDFRTS